MHVKSPMQIGTVRVDPGELTQGRVDQGNELPRGQLDLLPGRWRNFEGQTTKKKYKFNTKSD